MVDRDDQWASSGPGPGSKFDELISGGVIPVALGAVSVLLIWLSVGAIRGPSEDVSDSDTTAAAVDSSEPVEAEFSTDATQAGSLPDAARVQPAPDGPYVRAALEAEDFVLSGAVPNDEVAAQLLQAAEVAYAPRLRSELTVDEGLESSDWLVSSPQAIVLLPMITDGTILLSNDGAVVSGTAPNAVWVDRLQGALGEVSGLPVVIGDMEITNLQPPLYVISALDGRVALSGVIPTEDIRRSLVEGAIGAYGEGNVDDQLVVDAGVFSSLWMYNGGPLLQAMSTFPEYKLQIDGVAFSGYIRGGVTFEVGSAVFTEGYARILDVGVSVLTRDQSLQLIIEGHTDSDGPDDVNLSLSQQRADAVLNYFIENGIDPTRLTAIGKGEAVPIVPNDTVEGRARNRRIEFVLSTIS